VSLILNVIPVNLTNINDSTCSNAPYKWNGKTYNASGIYIDIFKSYQNCDSIVTLTLNVKTSPSNLVTVSGQTITAIEVGASYFWFNCANNWLISTGKTFTSNTQRAFKVIVLKNNCFYTSSCTNLYNVSIENQTNEEGLLVYPNTGKCLISSTRAIDYKMINEL
jgi:hypothetical protein